MYLKNRRSNSSCGSYINNSISMLSLEGSEVPNKQKKYQYGEIQKKYLVPVYHSIQEFENSKRDIIDKQILTEWKNGIKKSISRLRQFVKQTEGQNLQLTNSLAQIQQNKNKQIRDLKITVQEQLRFMQSQTNKKILNLNAEFGRKQQQYKEMISKFIQSMHHAQKTWTKTYGNLFNKFKKIEEIVRNNMSIDIRNKEVYSKIIAFTDQMYGEGDSFRSANSSIDQAENNPTNQKKNMFDFSSIQNFQEANQQRVPKFQVCLIRMICWNFFSIQNQNTIKKLFQIIKVMDSPDQIVQESIFPVILESLKINLDLEKQPNFNEVSEHLNISINDSQQQITLEEITNTNNNNNKRQNENLKENSQKKLKLKNFPF